MQAPTTASSTQMQTHALGQQNPLLQCCASLAAGANTATRLEPNKHAHGSSTHTNNLGKAQNTSEAFQKWLATRGERDTPATMAKRFLALKICAPRTCAAGKHYKDKTDALSITGSRLLLRWTDVTGPATTLIFFSPPRCSTCGRSTGQRSRATVKTMPPGTD